MLQTTFARRAVRGTFAAAAFSAFVAISAATAAAAEIKVSGGKCASAVHLVAREAPLSQVLAQLAKSLGFAIRFESDSDPLIDVDLSRTPLELVTQLAPLANVSVEQAPDARCSQGEKIVKMWVLSAPGGESAVRTAKSDPKAQQAKVAEERAKQAQQGNDQYLWALGFPGSAAPPRSP